MLYDPKWEVTAPTKRRRPWQKMLLEAANIVERRGLAKGRQEDDDGHVCVQGAISIAATGATVNNGDAYCLATKMLSRYLRATGVEERLAPETGCAYWNNQPERTQEDVVGALRAAADWRA